MASWWQRVLDALQVETQGKYAPQRVVALAKYRRETSPLAALAVLVLTSLLCVLVTVVADKVPLADPDEELDANWRFLLRHFFAFWLFAFIATVQFAHYLLSLPLSRDRIAVHAAIVSGSTKGFVDAIDCVVGFPVSFTLVSGTPIWAAVLVSLLWIAWGRRIRADKALWRSIFNSFVVWMCQLMLTYIYATYFYVYTLLPPTGRVGFAFLLPVIKLLVRVWLTHSVTHLCNELPEVVVLNAEVSNSLFIYCMQNTPSLLTTLGLMAIDFIQSTLSLRDINHIFKDVKALRSKAKDSVAGGSQRNHDGFVEKVEQIVEGRTCLQVQRVASRMAWTASISPLILPIQRRLGS